jgi:hypothetical protein
MVNPNTAADQQAYSTPNSKTAVEVKSGEAKCPYCGTIFKLL